MAETYEVKFFLKQSKTLNSDHELQFDGIDEFKLKPAKRMSIQFIDTDDLNLYAQNWILRNRKKEEEDVYELTYKKRYPIDGDNLQAELKRASEDGFDPTTGEFEGEVDWGYSKKVLSMSHEDKSNVPNRSNLELPSLDELQQPFFSKAPLNFINWSRIGWGMEQLKRAKTFGPIQAKKYKGEWNDIKTVFEIWTIHSESIVEVSIDAEDESTAKLRHSKLKELILEKGMLVEEDFSKTEWALARLTAALV